MHLKWGIVGLGRIANQFIQDLQLLPDTSVVAVAARDHDRAKKFAHTYGVARSYGSYSRLFQDPEVDIVYIATPHNSHAVLSIEAMQAGKHVLCEKPLAVNKAEVETMIKASSKHQVFLMEAFWSRFNPSIKEALQLVKDKVIGETNYVNADFTFRVDKTPDDRMLNMETAGGSLLEMGVYPVFLAYSVFGMPEQILATGTMHENGADLQTAVLLKFKEGIASLMSGYLSQSDMTARICGTKGRILIDPIWHESQGYTLVVNDQATEYIRPTLGKGFTYEIRECIKCIENGLLESPDWNHQDSLNMFTILDEIRRQTGLKYPFENRLKSSATYE